MNRLKLFMLTTLLVVMSVLPCGIGQRDANALVVGPNGYYTPDYFGTTPNWANSPLLTKFIDQLPGLWDPKNPGGGQPASSVPLAVPDTLTYPGSDYYEISLMQFTKVMHTDLPLGTKLRGYVQTNNGTNAAGTANDVAPAAIDYLGPVIVATKDRPVRIKFTNALPANAPGKLFVPVDVTLMGAGPGPAANWDGPDAQPADITCMSAPGSPTPAACFTENRAVLHLHGGRTPWISDGTPHQWIIPALDSNPKKRGASVVMVPDMWFLPDGTHVTACAGMTTCATPGATNDPGLGSQTYFYTNQQSARFLFYHDHAWGITRLNVYVGMAAGYLITDDKEQELITAGTIPGAADTIPLVIQDKTFVDAATVLTTDPTWAWGSNPAKPATTNPVTGDLWWPHVYMTAQNPYNPDFSGVNPMGRWVYGPWFWPPTPVCGSAPDAVKPFCIEYGVVPNPYAAEPGQPPEIPGTPNPSWGAEAFMDTPVVNGVAYPTVTLEAKKYRFRILNAAHDRFFNLQLYRAVNKTGYTNPTPALDFTGGPALRTEVAMVPAAPNAAYVGDLQWWPIDGREGGAPHPDTRGPAFVQITNEGGFLPKPVVLPNQPVNWVLDPTLFTAGLVDQQNNGGGTLMLGPAERADVIVDFTDFAGHTLILYNDAPAPWPALDPHYDYYTGAPDRRAEMGGADTTLPGQGPNIRTLMQIVVGDGTSNTGPATPNSTGTIDLVAMETAFVGAGGAFAASQDPIVVGQSAYDSTYDTTFPATWPEWGISRISDNYLQFKSVTGESKTINMKAKAIQDEMGEVFDDYGRMSAKLGLEVPFTNAGNNNFNLQNFVDPATEIVKPNDIQIWKITHNGVDTHPIHFHLFDVQVLNRVGWDGFMYLPDDNELGWKETVRISPLQDTIVALRPIVPRVPFAVPNSVRPLSPATPLGSVIGFSQIDPETGADLVPVRTNVMTNFGHEYVWHCHILSHEESDMMRPVILNTLAKTDILWRNTSTGYNAYWYMDDVTVTGSDMLAYLDPASGWTIAGRGDFNGDGKADILWRNTTTGYNAVWYMDGKTVTGTDFVPYLDPALGWSIVGTGDFNSDGKPDIIWRNTTNGANGVWFMNGITFINFEYLPGLAPATGWTIVGVGDFNSDSKPDIIWRNTSTGENAVWYMNGVTVTESPFLPPETDQTWTIASVGDFNNDLKPDILWRNIGPGPNAGQNRVWYMNGVSNTGVAMLPFLSTDWKAQGN